MKRERWGSDDVANRSVAWEERQMNRYRAELLCGFAGALFLAAQPAEAQRALGLAPAEGAAGLAKEVGKSFTFVCPVSDGTRASVYGTDVYTADSAVCAAAIHAGVLRPGLTGIVTIVIGSGADSFASTTRNGVTSKSYGRWGTSYTFARDGTAGQIGWLTVWSGVPTDFTEPVAVECPAGGTLNGGALWGTGVYTKDSTICVAAVHAGLITAEKGGVVVAQRVPGLKEYPATTRYGIASQQYGTYADAFSVTAPVGVKAPPQRVFEPATTVSRTTPLVPAAPAVTDTSVGSTAVPMPEITRPRTITLTGFAGSGAFAIVSPRTIGLAGLTGSGAFAVVPPRTITLGGFTTIAPGP
jgi:hypothetical protein